MSLTCEASGSPIDHGADGTWAIVPCGTCTCRLDCSEDRWMADPCRRSVPPGSLSHTIRNGLFCSRRGHRPAVLAATSCNRISSADRHRMAGARFKRSTRCAAVPARISGAGVGTGPVDGRRAVCVKPVVPPQVSRMWPVESTRHWTLWEPSLRPRPVVPGLEPWAPLERDRRREWVRWACPASPVRCRRSRSRVRFPSSPSARGKSASIGRNRCRVLRAQTSLDCSSSRHGTSEAPRGVGIRIGNRRHSVRDPDSS